MALPAGAVCILDMNTLSGSAGDLISAYTDSVGGGPGGTSAGSARLTLGLNGSGGRKYAVHAGGVNRISIPTITGTYNAFTMIIVCQHDDIFRANQVLVSGTDGTVGPQLYTNAGSGINFYDGAVRLAPYTVQAPVSGDVNIIQFSSGVSTSHTCVNNTLADNGYAVANPGSPWTGWYVGNNGGSNQSFKGKIYWVGIWNREFTTQEYADADAYLRGLFPFLTGSFAKNKARFIGHGDSIEYGVRVSAAGNTGWELALAASGIATKNAVNVSTGGRITSQSQALLAQEVIPHIPSDTPFPVVVCNFGSNDLTASLGGLDGAGTYSAILAYCAALKALRPNVKIVWETTLPRGSSSTFETERQALRTLLMANTTLVSGKLYSRSGTGPDYILDIATDASIGVAGSQNNATNYLGDLTHLTDAGAVIQGSDETPIFDQLYQQDVTAPVVLNASINAAGDTLTVNFTESGSAPVLPSSGITGFALTGGHTLSNGTRTTNTRATFPISPVVNQGETVTLSAVSSNLTDTALNALANFSGQAVTNNSTVAVSGIPNRRGSGRPRVGRERGRR